MSKKNNKLGKWPLDWNKHLLESSYFYFCDKTINLDDFVECDVNIISNGEVSYINSYCIFFSYLDEKYWSFVNLVEKNIFCISLYKNKIRDNQCVPSVILFGQKQEFKNALEILHFIEDSIADHKKQSVIIGSYGDENDDDWDI